MGNLCVPHGRMASDFSSASCRGPCPTTVATQPIVAPRTAARCFPVRGVWKNDANTERNCESHVQERCEQIAKLRVTCAKQAVHIYSLHVVTCPKVHKFSVEHILRNHVPPGLERSKFGEQSTYKILPAETMYNTRLHCLRKSYTDQQQL